jgi:hypothetical protein
VGFNLPRNWWVSRLQKSEFAVLVLGFEKLGTWNLTIVGGQPKKPIVASIVYASMCGHREVRISIYLSKKLYLRSEDEKKEGEAEHARLETSKQTLFDPFTRATDTIFFFYISRFWLKTLDESHQQPMGTSSTAPYPSGRSSGISEASG